MKLSLHPFCSLNAHTGKALAPHTRTHDRHWLRACGETLLPYLLAALALFIYHEQLFK